LDIDLDAATEDFMSSTLFALMLAATEPEIGTCDPVDGPPIEWSTEQRAEVRARVAAACKAMRAVPEVCELLDVAGARESSWSPSVRHVLGERENGLGVLGLSKRWHAAKWPEPSEPAFCSPEASVIVALDIVRRAQDRWGARTLVEVQAVFAGRFRCVQEEDRRECFILVDRWRDADICKRLDQRGVDCRASLPKRAAGRKVPLEQRSALATELARVWSERESA
jgi:hypothetical protein